MITSYCYGKFESREALDDALDILFMLEQVNAYMQAQDRFVKSYSYEDLMTDVSELAAMSNDPDSLMAEFWEWAGEIPKTPRERAKARATTDPWSPYKKLSARQRGELAQTQASFRIVDVRKHWGTYRQSKKWERAVPYTWQLLIDIETGGKRWILSLAPNFSRDAFCSRLQLNPTSILFHLEWKLNSKHPDRHPYLSIERNKLKL